MTERQTTDDPDRSASPAPSDFSAARETADVGSRVGALHVCPRCDSELVYPVDWAPAKQRAWSVDLRCPDCEWSGGGVYAQEIVDRFDDELDRGTEALIADLTLLTQANMEEQVEAFVAALHAGWILPDDF